jgi:hypothetical protein
VYSFFVESARNSVATVQNNVNINGVSHFDPESASESKSTDVSSYHVGEQVEAQGKLICDCQVVL